MNKDNKRSVDGFVRRDVGSKFGELHNEKKSTLGARQEIRRDLHTGSDKTRSLGVDSGRSLDRIDIAESLKSIDSQSVAKKKKFGIFKKKDKSAGFGNRRHKKGRRVIKWVIFLVLLGIIGSIGYVGYKFVNAGGNVFQGGILGIVRNEPLLTDANGRSNFVIFGTAEDDEGGTHGGANLTDSIMILSVDQKEKNAFMVSMPRDLWVTYDNTCTVGNQGKLNAVYFCASNDGEDEKAGSAALQSKLKDITGLEIQYYIHLNFTAVVDAVDAVGGVQVMIESKDPRGIFDDNFDWKCNHKCNMVKYPNGLTPVLDGQHALALARARGASGNTYGLPNANFDREKNQQKILEALRQKAMSAGTLSNLSSVTKLIDALGNNLRTNIDSKYIRTMASLASSIQSSNVISVSLVDPEDPQVGTGNAYGQSIVKPLAGLNDFSGIRDYLAKKITSDPIARESAEIVVLNGSGVVGSAQKEATVLEGEKYIITSIENAPATIASAYEIYQIDATKTATAAKLAEKYGVTLLTTKPPVTVSSSTAFVIVVGPPASTTNQSQ